MGLVLADGDAGGVLRTSVAVDAGVTLADNDGRVDVAIGTLGEGDLLNETIHEFVEFGVLCDGINGGAGLQPLIHIAVVEGRTMVLALNSASSDFKVAETVGAVKTIGIGDFPRGVPGVPHFPHTGAVHRVEDIAPEAASPAHGAHGQVSHFSLGTAAHVGETLGHYVCCCGTAIYETY